MDYRAMFDREYLGAWDLPRDVAVQISRVECKILKSARGEDKKPIIHFVGKEKAFVCNKTNGKTIAALYGTHVEDWVGKWITLYATTTSAGGETVECIRVRPQAPRPPAARTNGRAAAPPPEPQPAPEIEDRGDEPSPEEMS